MSHQKTNVTQQKREKTEIINPRGVRRTLPTLPLNDAPGLNCRLACRVTTLYTHHGMVGKNRIIVNLRFIG